MASELRVNTLKDAAGNNSIATSFVAGGSAKAWMNLNGTGTIAIQDSLNIASVVDNGTGQYTPSFSSAMNNINYAGAPAGNGGNDYNAMGRLTNLAASSFKMLMGYTSGYYDNEDTSVIIQGDLA